MRIYEDYDGDIPSNEEPEDNSWLEDWFYDLKNERED